MAGGRIEATYPEAKPNKCNVCALSKQKTAAKAPSNKKLLTSTQLVKLKKFIQYQTIILSA